MIILVCGGRDFADQALLDRTLDELGPCAVIHGDAPGADRLAKRWALDRAVPQRPYPADWRRHGRRAGPLRNQLMLDRERAISLVVAFPGGTGTADMVRRATARGIQVRKINY